MNLHRVRIEVDDRPGRLASVAAAIGGLGGNIVALDIHSVDGRRVADEMLVDVGSGLGPDTIESVLGDLSQGEIDVRAADAHDLVDRETHCLELARRVVRRGDAGADPAALVKEVVATEVAWLGSEEHQPLHGVAGRALTERRPVMGREALKVLPPSDAGFPWVLAVPVDLAGIPRVLVLARRAPRFSFTEAARVRALAGLFADAEGNDDAVAPRGAHRARLHDGGEVLVRDVRPADMGALARMHDRCSTASRYRRYFAGTPRLPDIVLRRLVDVDGRDRLGLVAALGSEVVGMVSCHRTGPAAAEMAILVEDAHQHRGIAVVLLRTVARRAAEQGFRQLEAKTLPDNRAVARLLKAAGFDATAHFEEGVRVLTFPVGAVAAVG